MPLLLQSLFLMVSFPSCSFCRHLLLFFPLFSSLLPGAPSLPHLPSLPPLLLLLIFLIPLPPAPLLTAPAPSSLLSPAPLPPSFPIPPVKYTKYSISSRLLQHIHTVYASSSSVYGKEAAVPFRLNERTDHPGNMYAATKRTDELLGIQYCQVK